MWEKDLVSIQEISETTGLTEAKIRNIFTRMQERLVKFGIQLKNRERRFTIYEVAVIEFVAKRTDEGLSLDQACDIAAKEFYDGRNPEIIREYLLQQLKAVENHNTNDV